jgi:hypothetical protein
MDFKLVSRTFILALASGLFTHVALAQWQWVDKDGRKVFSDRSPPSDVPDKNILKRPPGSTKPAPAPEQAVDAAAGTAAKPAASAALAKASAPKLTGKDAELEAKKKKADEEEVLKKKAEEEKLAKAKADNCDRAKASMATLQSGVRLASVNAKGEREIYDDTKRASETKRTQDIIDASCK